MVAAKWWLKMYEYEYIGLLENMLVFMKPAHARADDKLLEQIENTILATYDDWAKKSGLESTVARVLWVDSDLERGLIEETIRSQNAIRNITPR
jgi:hypothetical protein